MSKLYEISTRYLAALNYFDSEDVDPETVTDTLESIEGEMEDKAINIAKFSGNLNAESDSIDKAIKQMQTRKKAIDNKIVWLKDYLKRNMEATDITEIKCPFFCIKIKNNPPFVLIEDEDLIPDKYKETSTVIKIDKNAIKKDNGCVGAKIKSGTRIEIK